MTLRDLFRRKTPEPPYRWHVETKLEQQVWHARQVEMCGGLTRWLEMQRANQNAASAQAANLTGMRALTAGELAILQVRQLDGMRNVPASTGHYLLDHGIYDL